MSNLSTKHTLCYPANTDLHREHKAWVRIVTPWKLTMVTLNEKGRQHLLWSPTHTKAICEQFSPCLEGYSQNHLNFVTSIINVLLLLDHTTYIQLSENDMVSNISY